MLLNSCRVGIVLLTLVGLGELDRALSQPATKFAHERDVYTRFDSERVTKWGGSGLVGLELQNTQNPRIFFIDREGHREQVFLDIPNAARVIVLSFASGFDGTVAVVGYAWSTDERLAHFLIRIPPDRKTQIVTQLSPYVPKEVAIAGDGTIWTVGGIRTDDPDKSKAKPPVIRRFDASGKLLSSLSVPSKAAPERVRDSASLSHMFASRDRVGWFTNGCEYIEFSLTGDVISRFDGPAGLDNAHVSGAAMDIDNRVFVGGTGSAGFQIFMLDRAARTWLPAAMVGPQEVSWAGILGFDGTTLVTSEQGVLRRRVRTDHLLNPGKE